MRFDLFVFLCCSVVYMTALYKFCEKYFHCFRIDKKIFMILFAGLEEGMNLNGSVGTGYILSVIVSHILFVGLFVIAFRDSVMKKVFAALILIAVKTLAWDFGCSFFPV